MQRPLFIIAILFSLGICLEKFIDVPFLLLFVLTGSTLALSLAFSILKKNSTVLIFVSYFLLGSLFYSNATILPANHIDNFKFLNKDSVYLKGIVTSFPEKRTQSRINKTVFIFETSEIKLFNNWHKTSGRVLVQDFHSGDLSYGDYLILQGRLLAPRNFFFNSRISYAEYLAKRGIHLIFSVKKQNLVERLGQNKANFLISVSFKAKKAIGAVIKKSLPPLEAGILSAFILGERNNLSREINNLFVQTGTVHILAISGFNVGIVIFIVLILLKALRLNKSLRFVLTIIFIILYAIITGSQPSVIRASIMAVVILIGILLQRESDIYNSLSFAALIILMLNPRTLFDVGFQLSFLSVISIVWLNKKIEKLIRKLFNPKSLVLTWVLRSICISMAAWLGVAGLVVYYFNILSPVTVLANLFIVPLSSLIVAAGFCLIIFGSVFPAFAFIFAGSVKLCLDLLVYAVWIFNKLPMAFFYLKTLSFYEVLAYYLILFIVFYKVKPASEISA